jgi:predicted GNAT family acetyltransferase
VAHPEKALLDQWHLSAGEWSDDRIHEMRYRNRANSIALGCTTIPPGFPGQGFGAALSDG